mmetsp:Transcript_1831/g.4757  ORF Transcript_1831/g.4757 Transcript_1831/m.4757 type:complete len:231 (-) Transcript_1831:641-1333(-)
MGQADRISAGRLSWRVEPRAALHLNGAGLPHLAPGWQPGRGRGCGSAARRAGQCPAASEAQPRCGLCGGSRGSRGGRRHNMQACWARRADGQPGHPSLLWAHQCNGGCASAADGRACRAGGRRGGRNEHRRRGRAAGCAGGGGMERGWRGVRGGGARLRRLRRAEHDPAAAAAAGDGLCGAGQVRLLLWGDGHCIACCACPTRKAWQLHKPKGLALPPVQLGMGCQPATI